MRETHQQSAVGVRQQILADQVLSVARQTCEGQQAGVCILQQAQQDWQCCQAILPVQCNNTHAWTAPEREGDRIILGSAQSCNGELLALLHSGSIELLWLPLGLWRQSENVPKHPILKLIPSLTCRHQPALTVSVCWEYKGTILSSSQASPHLHCRMQLAEAFPALRRLRRPLQAWPAGWKPLAAAIS